MFVRGCQVLKHLRQSYWYRLGVCLDLTLQISHFVKRLHPYWQHRQENLLHFQLYLRLAYLQKRLLCHWNLKWCYGVGSRARQSSSWLHQAWADSHEADSKGAHQFWEWQFSGFHPATFAVVQLEQQSVDLRLLPSSCLAISLQKGFLWVCPTKGWPALGSSSCPHSCWPQNVLQILSFSDLVGSEATASVPPHYLWFCRGMMRHVDHLILSAPNRSSCLFLNIFNFKL